MPRIDCDRQFLPGLKSRASLARFRLTRLPVGEHPAQPPTNTAKLKTLAAINRRSRTDMADLDDLRAKMRQIRFLQFAVPGEHDARSSHPARLQ